MSAVKLPRSLEEKFGELAARVRRLWLIRGVCLFALLLVGTAAAAVLLDSQLTLPTAARAGLLVGWLAVAAVAFRRFVWRPLKGEMPVDRLAAAIERQFPSLAERLTTLIELTRSADPGNGSKALIGVLAKETAQRTQRLNFDRAAPTGSSLRVAIGAAFVTLLVLAPLVFVPGAAERVRRFLLPWYAPVVEVPFKVVVSSGSPVVKRGEAVTLTAYLERLKPDAPLPELATLVYEEDGTERKLPMTGDEKAAFHVTRPEVQTSFRYRVDAGAATSEWFGVTVVEPVELIDGTAVTITPPEYARAAHPPKTTAGLQEFEAVQYSRVTFTLKFSRPATAAYFEWKPSTPGAVVQGERYTAALAPDRSSGTAEMLLADTGTLTLVLVGEQNVRTTATLAAKAVTDAPPKFEKVTNVSPKPREVRPDDRVLIELAATDDIGVAAATLEYEVNRGKAKSLPVPLKGANGPKADARYPFALAGLAAAGDTVRFRLRVADGRRVPEFHLHPQEAVFPESGWSELTLNPNARPLLEQDVAAQQERFKEKLLELVGEVNDARRPADELVKDAAGKPDLTPGDRANLNKAKEKAAEVARKLDELAREADLTPDLRPLANAIRGTAEQTLRQAERELQKADNEPDPKARDQALAAAAKKLAEASARLNDLLAKNDRAARDRLDRDKLERLAAEQRRLAEEAEQAANDPAKAAELARRQKELKAELDELRANSPTLKEAAEAEARERANQLADEAKELADEAERVARGRADRAAAARQQARDAAARRQKEINAKAAELGNKTDGPAKLADAPPLDEAPFDAAAAKLEKGDAVGAMTEQEKAARELDRLADALDRAAAARRDPKEAARQLARAEEELRKQAKEPTADKDRLARNQKAIRDAARKLSVPPGDGEAEKAGQEALARLDAAAEQPTDENMAAAAEALSRFADKLPSRAQRLRKSAEQLERLQREQEAVRQEAEDKLRGFDRKTPDAALQKEAAEKLAAAADKQAELAKKIDELDAPGLEARRDRASAAARRAAEDLKAGRTQDVPAGQSEARRSLDQLKQAADGQTPSDVQADALARQQRQLADRAAGGQPSKDQLQQMANQQRDLAEKMNGVRDPDAAQRLSRAKDAAKAAAAAAERQDVDELRKKSKEAADELDSAADDLAGAESDAARADRLAKERQAAADKSQKGAGRPTPAEESAEAKAELDRQADELRRTRAGDAQAAKKKAADALDKLRKQPNPERAVQLQKQAADAMKELSEAVGGRQQANGERGDPDAKAEPDDANGQLPSKKDADAARQLADQTRGNRDQLAKDDKAAADGPKNADPAGLQKLAEEEGKLAEQADKAGSPEAAAAAREAAGELKAGNPDRAKAAGERAKRKLDQAAQDGTNKPAGELAKKQGELNEKMGQAAGDPAAANAQAGERQKELSKQADRLAEKLDKGETPGQKGAADAAREAGKQMDRAAREGEAGRGQSAGEASKKASEAAARAKEQAAKAAGKEPGQPGDGQPGEGQPGQGKEGEGQPGKGQPGKGQPGKGQPGKGQPGVGQPGEGQPGPGQGKPDPSAKAAGQSAKAAGEAMDKAAGKLGQKDGKGAAEQMKAAADKADQAAEQLGGKGEPGQPGQPGQPGGQASGQNPGVGPAPPTAGLPADLAQYEGKPWGELPGEVRAKILTDLKAKYGEDYARVIKLYFEQLAEKK